MKHHPHQSTIPERLGQTSVLALLAMAAFLVLVFSTIAQAKAPWDPDEVTLTAHDLGSGVYSVLPDDAFEKDHVATTAGFVIGEDSVLLIETMVNRELTEQLLALVRQETDLPIRYVVNTSYHGDHSYGNYPRRRCHRHPASGDRKLYHLVV